MTTTTRSARGASAYTQTESYSTRPLDESGLFSSNLCSQPTHSWSQLIDDLLIIRNLQDDWDGQGADAPLPALVDGAITLAQCLQEMRTPPAARIIAGVNGTVVFEWFGPADFWFGPAVFLEIEVTAPDWAEVRYVREGVDEAQSCFLSRRA